MIGYLDKISRMTNKKEAVTRPASLFIRDDEDMGIIGFPFDLFISEDHDLKFNVSDHPIQNGCVISDHVQQELRSVSIEGMFTNHPIWKKMGMYKDKDVKVNRILGTVNTESEDNVSIDGIMQLDNRARSKYEALEALAKRKKPVRLVTSLVVYPQMIITSIKAKRDPKSGESVQFSMDLREIEMVTLQEVSESYVYSPPNMDDIRNRLLAQKVNNGKQAEIKKKVDELYKMVDPEWAL